MSDTIHFIAGLPRAGGTLLANLLMQNPRFDASAPAGILAVALNVRASWDVIFANPPAEEAKVPVMRGVLRNFHRRRPRPVAFDRSPAWLAHLETGELLLERKAKVLVPVRDLRDVLSSFESIWQQNAGTAPFAQQQKYPGPFETLEGRCSVWLRTDEPVGLAYARIEDALRRGLRDRLHFVRFEDLTARPRETMQGVYQFLGEEPFDHDFEHIEPIGQGIDLFDPRVQLPPHRPKLEPSPPRHEVVLGPLAQKYAGVYAWDQPL